MVVYIGLQCWVCTSGASGWLVLGSCIHLSVVWGNILVDCGVLGVTCYVVYVVRYMMGWPMACIVIYWGEGSRWWSMSRMEANVIALVTLHLRQSLPWLCCGNSYHGGGNGSRSPPPQTLLPIHQCLSLRRGSRTLTRGRNESLHQKTNPTTHCLLLSHVHPH